MAVTTAAGSLILFNVTVAQILPPQKRAEHVEITNAPELEWAVSYMAIVRWTTPIRAATMSIMGSFITGRIPMI